MKRLAGAASLVAPFVFLAIYITRAGHGFLLDDFAWILDSRVRSFADLARVLAGTGGFFRPVVGLTFTINEWLFDAHPLGYGLTNVALALAGGAAVVSLARAFSLSVGSSRLAGILWLMNFHFPRTGIMWISGRTALVVAIAAACSASSVLRGRLTAALLWLAVALFAKEEAVLLPFIVLAWLVVLRGDEDGPPVPINRWIVGAGFVLGVYVLARSFTVAMTPASAPDYYRFTFDPSAILQNIVEYADRTSTLVALVMLLALVFLGWSGRVFEGRTMRIAGCGAIWLIGALGFAYLLPIRSDLYAAVPAIGACVVAAAVVERLWEGSTPLRRRLALVAAIVLPLMLTPVYWQRSQRMARQADFSATILGDLEQLTRALPAGARVVIDDRTPETAAHSATMAAAFGAQLNQAGEVQAGRKLDLVLASELGTGGQTPPRPALWLSVQGGRLKVVDHPPR